MPKDIEETWARLTRTPSPELTRSSVTTRPWVPVFSGAPRPYVEMPAARVTAPPPRSIQPRQIDPQEPVGRAPGNPIDTTTEYGSRLAALVQVMQRQQNREEMQAHHGNQNPVGHANPLAPYIQYQQVQQNRQAKSLTSHTSSNADTLRWREQVQSPQRHQGAAGHANPLAAYIQHQQLSWENMQAQHGNQPHAASFGTASQTNTATAQCNDGQQATSAMQNSGGVPQNRPQ